MIFSLVAALVGVTLLTGCTPNATEQGSTGDTSKPSSLVEPAVHEITLLELNDLHAHLLPHWEQIRQENGRVLLDKRGGLARIASKIAEVRASGSCGK
ncbi:MAG: hypothetical protein ACWA44_05465 [Thiotrichales bacterium]